MADELEAVLQEARFAPRAMTRMLDELFGEQNPQAELLVPEHPIITAPSTPSAANFGTVKLEAGEPALPNGQLPVLEDDEESYTGVSSVRRLPVKPRRTFSWMAAAAGVALTIAGGAVLVGSRHKLRNDGNVATLPPEPLAETKSAPAVSTDPPATAEPPAASTPSENVSVKISTDPSGAEVTAEDGIRLGSTPTTLSIKRSDKPLVLVIAKTGFVSSRQTIIPDRDVSALVTLKADLDGGKKKQPAATPRPKRRSSAAPGDGRVREGLSIDPFAEDPKAR
jgi:hypothetical protein